MVRRRAAELPAPPLHRQSMPKLCANLHFLYLELPLLQRFQAAADDGFDAVEMTFPYSESPTDLRHAADAAGVQVVEFNAPAGELLPGVRRGLAAVPGRGREFIEHIEEGIRYARVLGCPRLLTLAGVVAPGDDRRPASDAFVANLRTAADLCARHQITLLIETNNLRDFPNYFLRTMDEVRGVLDAVDRPNVRALFDFYHVQINEGDVYRRFNETLDLIDHVQFANPPLRHEPGAGDLDFDHLFQVIDASGYDGWVGAEHFASDGCTAHSLQWLQSRGLIAPRREDPRQR